MYSWELNPAILATIKKAAAGLVFAAAEFLFLLLAVSC